MKWHRSMMTRPIALLLTLCMAVTLIPPITVSAAGTPTTLAVGETVKFAFGSGTAPSDSIAVSADRAYYTDVTSGTVNVDASSGYAYGFIGIGEDGYKASDRTDGLEMVEGMEITLEDGNNGVSAKQTIYNANLTGKETDFHMGDATMPIRFAMKVDRNSYYTVKATLANSSSSEQAEVSLFSERRHQIITDEMINIGGTKEVTFNVAVADVYFQKSEPTGTYLDDQLNIVVTGKNAALKSLEITRIAHTPTIRVVSDSTGCDQYGYIPVYPLQNYTGVGQGLTAYFQDVPMSNHGEGGLASSDNAHLNSAKAALGAGDYLYVEYGHNENSLASFAGNLAKYYNAANDAGAVLLLVGPIDRSQSSRYQNGRWTPSLDGYSKVAENYVKCLIYGGPEMAASYAGKIAGNDATEANEYADGLTTIDTAKGVTNAAFINLNAGWVEFLNRVAGTTSSNANFYYTHNKRGNKDATHINDYGASQAAYIFAQQVKETYEAGKDEAEGTSAKIQANVLEALYNDYTSNRSDVHPDTVPDTVISAGQPASNDHYPQEFVAEEKPPYPVVIDEIKMENGALTAAAVSIVDNLTSYAKVGVKITNGSGQELGTVWTTDWLDNTSQHKGDTATLHFETSNIAVSKNTDYSCTALVYPVDQSTHEYMGSAEAISEAYSFAVKNGYMITNLSLGKTGTPDRTARSGYPVTNATDGDHKTYFVPNATNTASSNITVDLGGIAVIDHIELYSWAQFTYTIEASSDNTAFTKIAEAITAVGTKDEDTTGDVYDMTVVLENPAAARYVRVTLDNPTGWTAIGFDVYGYIPDDLSELPSEPGTDPEPGPDETAVNLSLNKTVTGKTTESSKNPLVNAVDGDHNTCYGTSGKQTDYTTWVQVDLGKAAEISSFDIYGWGNFTYTIEVSEDGQTFTEAARSTAAVTAKDDKSTNAEMCGATVTLVKPVTGQYVKATLVRTDSSQWPGIGLDVWGSFVETKPETLCLSLNKPGTASSDAKSGYPINYALDGNNGVDGVGKPFYVPGTGTSNTAWVQVDLGAKAVIDHIYLYSWALFNYKIEASADGVTFTTIKEETEYIGTKPEGAKQDVYDTTVTLDAPMEARYIKVNLDNQSGWTAIGFDVYGYYTQSVDSVTISGGNTVKVGETVQLTATVTPNTVSSDVTWASSDTTVATVDAMGLVTGAAAGTVTIKATSKIDETKTATHEITVTDPPQPIKLSVEGANVSLNETLKLTATLTGISGGVTWTSADNAVVTVTADGTVTAVAIGTTTVTATCGNDSAAAVITVYDKTRETENLAWLKNVTATREKSPNIAVNAVDGDLNTYWSNGEDGRTKTESVTIDLGERCFVDYVNVIQAWSPGIKFKVEISEDGNTYQPFYDHSAKFTNTNGNTNYINRSDPGAGRYGQYLKVTITGVEDTNGKAQYMALSEIEAIGYTVTVHEDDGSITISQQSVTLLPGGDTVQLTVNGLPNGQSVTWMNGDRRFATVQDGLVTSVGVGTTEITAKAGSKTFKIPVRVIADKNMITNDAFYVDTNGDPILAQGGGIFKFGDTYYWYGVKYKQAEDYSKNPTVSTASRSNNTTFSAVTCYTSKDLVNWTYRGDVVTPETFKTAEYPNAHVMWFGRLGVMYNQETQKYVLVSQGYVNSTEIENTGTAAELKADIGNALVFLTADTPDGPFTGPIYQKASTGALASIAGKAGEQRTGDQTVFIDDDGKAYLVASNSGGRSHVYICEFNEDYTWLETATEVYSGEGKEGNCMFKYDGHYYIANSDLHGWNASPAYVLKSKTGDIKGEYEMLPEPMTGSKEGYSHVSQTGFFYTIQGTEQTTVLFCGDRWSGFGGNGMGFYSWVPLSFDENGDPIFNDLSQFYLDAKTGKWEIGPFNNYVTNPAFEADRVKVSDPMGWDVSGGTNVQNSSPFSGRWSWRLSSGSSVKQTITNLPDGQYTLKLWTKGSGTGYAYINNSTGTQIAKFDLNGHYSDWTQMAVCTDLEIAGICEIGVVSSSGTVDIDDFTLIKTTETKVPEASKYTITYSANGGTGIMSNSTATEGVAFTLPQCGFTAPEGKVFDTWAIGSVNGTKEAAGSSYTFTKATTVYAVWKDLSYDITGIIKQKGIPVSGATVTLKLGADTIGTANTTDTDGKFAFNNIPAGIYNLVVEKDGIIKTVKQVITNTDADLTIELPDGKENSVVKVEGTGTPQVVVGGLDTIFEVDRTNYSTEDKNVVKGGGEVKFELNVKEQDPAAEIKAQADKINDVKKDTETVGLYLDLTLTKTVTPKSGTGTETSVREISTLIETLIPLPERMRGKAGYSVYRVHDGKVESIKQGGNGEHYTVSSDKTTISIFASKYSIYAIAYSEKTEVPGIPETPETPSSSSGGGSSTKTYVVSIGKIEHGKVTANPANAASGRTVTLTVTPDAGYVLHKLTVTDSKGKEISLTDKNTFVMPSGGVTVKATFVLEGQEETCDGGADCPSRAYLDLDTEAWYHAAVDYAIREGLLTGYGNGSFDPAGKLSRAMLAQILYNMEGRPSVSRDSGFVDVKPDAWYADAVAWAAAQGIVAGYGNGLFGPNDALTREQLAVVLWRYNKEPSASNKALDYTDAGQVSGWALDALRWAVENSILNGKGNGILDPKGLTSRAETAQVLYNLRDK